MRSGVRDIAVQGTNDSSIASKRAVENLYSEPLRLALGCDAFPPWYQHVARNIRRSPAIHRGYFLRVLAIRDSLNSLPQKDAVVVNLGCGFDVLPFQLLSNGMPYRRFLDVDYEPLLENKARIIRAEPAFLQAIGSIDHELNTETYHMVPCDLNNDQEFMEALKNHVPYDSRDVIYIAEVSLAYMDPESADKIIEQCSKFAQELGINAHFILLEQCTPSGPQEPFARQMLNHFEKNKSPLRSVLKYPTLQSQISRFNRLGFHNVYVNDLWAIWESLLVDIRESVDSVEPFDELEEFQLFSHSYLLLVASHHNKTIIDNRLNISRVNEAFSISLHPPTDIRNKFGACVQLDSGEILMIGGANPSRNIDAWQYHNGLWSKLQIKSDSKYPRPRMCHDACLLSENSILVTGGRGAPHQGMNDTWLLSLKNGHWHWTQSVTLPQSRFRHRSFKIDENTVCILGGNPLGPLCQLIHIESGGIEGVDIMGPFNELPVSGFGFASKNGVAVIVGGSRDGHTHVSDSFHLVKFELGKLHIFKTFRSSAWQRYGCQVEFVSDHEVLVIGGTSPTILFDEHNSVVKVDIRTGDAEAVPIPTEVWQSHCMLIGFQLAFLGTRKLAIIGGDATCYGFGAVQNKSFSIEW